MRDVSLIAHRHLVATLMAMTKPTITDTNWRINIYERAAEQIDPTARQHSNALAQRGKSPEVWRCGCRGFTPLLTVTRH